MNIKNLKKLKLHSLLKLNQNQRIRLVEYEFKKVMEEKFNIFLANDVNKQCEKLNNLISDYNDIEDYLIEKGFYSDVYFARYKCAIERVEDLEPIVIKSVYQSNLNIMFGKLVSIRKDLFTIEHMLNLYYNHLVSSIVLPIKYKDDDFIFEDFVHFTNEKIFKDLDSLIGIYYENLKIEMKSFKDIGFYDTLFNSNDVIDVFVDEIERFKEIYNDISFELDNLEKDGFSISKENNVNIRTKIAKECNERNDYTSNDIGYMETEDLEPYHNDVFYDLKNKKLILPKDFNQHSYVNDLEYLSLVSDDSLS